MKRLILFAGTFVAFAVTLSFGFSVKTSAVDASDWNAGNIIDDSVFTDSSAMSVKQIQSWLDSRLANCDEKGSKASEFGGGTRAQYGAANGNPAPFTCLNKYYEVPKTTPGGGIPANNYGKSSIPSGAKSAAQIIYDAGKKYSISPKVLLVKLGTESPGPLTSDTWPFKSQYYYAMGAHCPDSGPNGSANCDDDYAGFSLQMYEAAKLLRSYLDNMDKSWWPYKKANKTNYVLWQVVERSCGGKNVYIANKATAALYTYTPYQPNAAALKNMYGTGDNCSTYGNRNFWRVFSDWFGSTYGYKVGDKMTARYEKIGGSSSRIGVPKGNQVCRDGNTACFQKFSSGYMYWKQGTGTWEVSGAIQSRYASLRSEHGSLGYPKTAASCNTGTSQCYQRFEGGYILWKSGVGAWEMRGAIRDRYASIGAEHGALGSPASGMNCSSSSQCYQKFEGGYILWKSGVGAWEMRGAIRDRYASIGAEHGVLKYPTGSSVCNDATTACYQEFEGGRMYWKTMKGAWENVGEIRKRYDSVGGANGSLGYPENGQTCASATQCYQRYENGYILWKSDTGAWDISGDVRTRYAALKAEFGPLGNPAGAEKCTSDGDCYQKFEGGYILQKNGQQAWEVRGSIRKTYERLGVEHGKLGYPLSGENCTANKSQCYQKFEGGYILWKPGTGAWESLGSIRAVYQQHGVEHGKLGFPTGAEICTTTSCYQVYEHGRIDYDRVTKKSKVSFS